MIIRSNNKISDDKVVIEFILKNEKFKNCTLHDNISACSVAISRRNFETEIHEYTRPAPSQGEMEEKFSTYKVTRRATYYLALRFNILENGVPILSGAPFVFVCDDTRYFFNKSAGNSYARIRIIDMIRCAR